MSRKFLLGGLIMLVAVAGIVSSQLFRETPPVTRRVIQFVNYIQSGLPEQDVFIHAAGPRDENRPASRPNFQVCDPSNQFAAGFLQSWMLPPPLVNPCAEKIDVVRARPRDALLPAFLAKQLYATTKVIPHDPYRTGPSPLGPFPGGDALGFTWREWLEAKGSGTYTVEDGDAQLDLVFTDLIPNGTYSLWCGRETSPPNFSAVEVPCETGSPAQTQFHANSKGKAHLALHMKPVLPRNSQGTSVLSLSYDRVVATTDGEPGGYGLNNHVQLWFPFP